MGNGAFIALGILLIDPPYSGPTLPEAISIIFLSGGAMLFGTSFILAAIKQHILLHADAIETVGLIFRSRLRRDEIGAKAPGRLYRGTVLLFPWRKDLRHMAIGNCFRTDDLYRQWIDSIPDAGPNYDRDRRRGLFTGPKIP